MANHVYGYLPEQAAEDALHANRLLAIEERPFQRVTRCLLGKDSLMRSAPRQLPSPPPEGEEAMQDSTSLDDAQREKFRGDVLLDFAALESSITRIQLIQNSNQRERDRYAAEKAKILATAQSVRENTIVLREQLAEAQRILELRRGYDALAAKILDDKKLKSREDSQSDIRALQKEISELEQESAEFEGTWQGRREQFERVVAEGEVMKKVIKGIKDIPEDDEGEEKDDEAMDEADEEDGEEDGKETRSRLGTPALEEGRTPRFDIEEATPAADGEDYRPHNKLLDVEGATRDHSRASSPSLADVEMADSGGSSQRTEPTVDDLNQDQPKTPTGAGATETRAGDIAGSTTEKMGEEKMDES